MNDVSFRDWRRTEQHNTDLTEGFLDNGKRCVFTFPWQEDPVIMEQGSWARSRCDTPRPFVCQHFASTVNYRVNINSGSVFNGTSEVLGGSFTLSGVTNIVKLVARQSSDIILLPDSELLQNLIRTVVLIDGSKLRLIGPGNFTSIGDSFIGEPIEYGLQPALVITPQANFHIMNSVSQQNVLSKKNSTVSIVSGRLDAIEGGRIVIGLSCSLEIQQVRNNKYKIISVAILIIFTGWFAFSCYN